MISLHPQPDDRAGGADDGDLHDDVRAAAGRHLGLRRPEPPLLRVQAHDLLHGGGGNGQVRNLNTVDLDGKGHQV